MNISASIAGSVSLWSLNSSCEKPIRRLPIACIAWCVRSIENPPARNIAMIESMYAITTGVGSVRVSITRDAQGWRSSASRAERIRSRTASFHGRSVLGGSNSSTTTSSIPSSSSSLFATCL